MFENSDVNLFVVVALGSIVAMTALWFFVLEPMERRDHERKLEILRQRMKSHQEHPGGSSDTVESPGIAVDSHDGT